MIPGSRGIAGVGALVGATGLLLLGAWFAFGARDPAVEHRLSLTAGPGRSGPSGPDASALAAEVNALSSEIEDRSDARPAHGDVRFRMDRKAPPPEPPRVPGLTDLAGQLDGAAIVLTWRPSGSAPAAGYRVERVGKDGAVVLQKDLPAEVLSWRDSEVDALSGSRTYRVLAIGRDGTVADGRIKKVPFRVEDYDLDFLGADEAGAGRFRIRWQRGAALVAKEFTVEPGDRIGGPIPAADDHPALDLGTGWRFAGFAGKRDMESREVRMPRFSPDGLLEKDPETGQVVFDDRKVSVPRVVLGARLAPVEEGTARPKWVPKAKD